MALLVSACMTHASESDLATLAPGESPGATRRAGEMV